MEEIQVKNIVAMSGSLRADSSTMAVLRCIATLAPQYTKINIYEGLAGLPHFSPELDGDSSPATVKHFRSLLKQANGVIICTPEYAYGIPGVLKNALDWTVSSGELYQTPVVAISASPMFTGGDKALASLLLTLQALGAIEAGTLSIPLINKKLSDTKEVTDYITKENLKAVINSLVTSIRLK